MDIQTFIPEQTDRLIYGIPQEHDHAACNALKEYDRLCKPWDDAKQRGSTKGLGLPSMQKIAEKHKTTIDEMKKHWHCIK